MTAIDDILKAEKDAAAAIESAKEAADKKLAALKAVRETALTEKRQELKATEATELESFAKELETKTKAAAVALSGDADQIRHNFTEQKAALTKFVKESL